MTGFRPVARTRQAVRDLLARTDVPDVAVAVSGGADSLALAAATAYVASRRELTVHGLIVDHQLQPGSADVAAAAAKQLHGLGIDDVRILTVTVTGRGGPEAAARTARYDALRSAGFPLVLLGHTLDDQAETVLLGLGRGSGPRSIAGMRDLDFPWGRPFLSVPRATTVAACEVLGLTVWEDPHNVDPAYTRVRLRREVLPLLEDVLQGGVAPALARTATQLRDDAEALDTLAARLLEAALITGTAGDGSSGEAHDRPAEEIDPERRGGGGPVSLPEADAGFRRPGESAGEPWRAGETDAESLRVGEAGAEVRRAGEGGAESSLAGEIGAETWRRGEAGAGAGRLGEGAAEPLSAGEVGAESRQVGEVDAEDRRAGQGGAEIWRRGEAGAGRLGEGGAESSSAGEVGAESRQVGEVDAEACRAAEGRAETWPRGEAGAESRQAVETSANLRRAGETGAGVPLRDPAVRSQLNTAGELDVAVLSAEPPALRRRVLRRWLLDAGVPELTDAHLRSADALIGRWRGQGDVWLPGNFAVGRARGRLRVTACGRG